jgi:hypothetical protein
MFGMGCSVTVSWAISFLQMALLLEAFTRICLKIIFPFKIEDLERETGKLVTFMQDGAPPHSCQSVRKTSNEKFSNAWI